MYSIIFAVILILIAIICNDIEDTLAHHYEESIFNPGTVENPDYSSFWYPDWTRKYNPDGSRQTWFNIRTRSEFINLFLQIPAWIFDGWHFTKFIRQNAIANAIYLFLPWSGVLAYFEIICIFASMVWGSHNLLYRHKFYKS